MEIPPSLAKLGLDTNYYGQKLAMKDYDEISTTSQQIADSKSKVDLFCLGIGGDVRLITFCSKSGAKLLRIAQRLHFDVSFKSYYIMKKSSKSNKID